MLFETLRHETRRHHARLEAAVPLLSPTAGIDDYIRYLQAMHGFHLPMEEALEAKPLDAAFELARRRKTDLLERDLAALDASCGPLCPGLPDIDGPAGLDAAVGCLYVLEGATLGGAVLHRSLAARWPDAIGRAGAYLGCYGSEKAAMWRRLRAAAEERPIDSEAAVRGARQTFECLQAWLS